MCVRWNALILVFSLIGCGGVNSPSNVSTPIIDLSCTSDQSSNCSALGHNKSFRVGVATGNTGVDCSTLFMQAGSQLFDNFVISGTATSEFTGTELRATLDSFVDSENGNTTTVSTEPATICVHLDVNEDDLLNNGEPISSKSVQTLGINQLLDDWSDF